MGCVGGAARRHRHRRAHRRRPEPVGQPRAACPVTASRRSSSARSVGIPVACSRAVFPVDSYGEDIGFWADCRTATQGRLRRVGQPVVSRRAGPRHLRAPARRRSPRVLAGTERPRLVEGRRGRARHRRDRGTDRVGARRGAWRPHCHRPRARRRVRRGAGGRRCRQPGRVGRGWPTLRAEGNHVRLTAELGLWGYTPTPADPYIFNHRVFPGAEMLTDCSRVLGMVMSGPGTRSLACIGAAQVDRDGNVNSTTLQPAGPFLVGSGGAQRRGQPGRRVHRDHAGPPEPCRRTVRVHHVAGAHGARGVHRPRRARPRRRRVAHRRGASRARGASTTVSMRSASRAATAPMSPATLQNWPTSPPPTSSPSAATTPKPCSSPTDPLHESTMNRPRSCGRSIAGSRLATRWCA